MRLPFVPQWAIVRVKEFLRDVNYYPEDGVYRVVEGDFEWYIPHQNILKVDFHSSLVKSETELQRSE